MNDIFNKNKNIESLLGIEPLSSLRSPFTSRYLTALLDKKFPIVTPNASDKIEHEQYLKIREELAQATILAGYANDPRLKEIIRLNLELQQRYATQVIKGVNAGIKDQKELLEAANKELEEAKADLTEYEELKKRQVGELGSKGITRYISLESKVQELQKTKETRDQAHRIITNVSRVETTLKVIIESENQAVHYRIPSIKEAEEQLGRNEYDGPKLDPIILTNKADIVDLFNRNVKTNEIRAGEQKKVTINETTNLPLILTELLNVYQYTLQQKIGTSIATLNIIENLQLKEIGTKGLASYLEEHESIFGVQTNKNKSGARSFTRKSSGTNVDQGGFLEYMTRENLKNLQAPDRRQVNEFYFNKLLELLRELPEGYEGFTNENLKEIARKNSYSITEIFISRRLSSGTDLRVISENERYKFSQIIPTETQTRYVQEIVLEQGENLFTPEEIATEVTKRHKNYKMLDIIAKEVLTKNYDLWNYRQASKDPVQYQKNSKTTNTTTAVKEPKRFA